MRILVLEDDPLIAFDLQICLEDAGHDVIGPFGSLAEARSGLWEALDFAFLDVDLPDGKSFGFAGELVRRDMPFCFVSGSMSGDMPEHLRHVPFIPKPFAHAAIRSSLARRSELVC